MNIRNISAAGVTVQVGRSSSPVHVEPSTALGASGMMMSCARHATHMGARVRVDSECASPC